VTTQITVESLTHHYRDGRAIHTVLQDVSLTVPDGQITVVTGPSGCGKSTLLRCIAGLIQPSSGSIRMDGRVITAVPSGIALITQDYTRSLPAWLTAAKTIDLCLRGNDLTPAQRRQRVQHSLAAVGLADSGDRYPSQLSGGMQQRVAIARALAVRPRLLLLDEPFASVDAQTRFTLEDVLLAVNASTGVTTVLVTHDIDEAVYVADQLVVLTAGPAATVNEAFPVDLPVPRNQITSRESASFRALRDRTARALHRTPMLPPAQSAREETHASRP
jgi:NitT/TauT family transport system ATP-binding protein